jgi:hypothetical protein
LLELAKIPLNQNDPPSPKRGLILLATIILFFCGSLINPYGLKVWAFIFQSAAKVRPYLSEWGPIHPVEHFFSHADFMVLALITAVAVLASKKRNITSCGILGLGLAAAIVMRRNIPLFAIIAGCLGTCYVENAVGDKAAAIIARVPGKILALVLSLFLAASVFYALTFNKNNPLQIEVEKDKYPVDTLRFMKENSIEGNALVFFDWAEYSIWHLYPDCLMFLDGRFVSAYREKTIDAYFDFIYRAPGWSKALSEYPTDIVLIHKGNPVYKDMLALEGWTFVLEDNISGLFLKTDKHSEFLEKLKHPEGINMPASVKHAFFP